MPLDEYQIRRYLWECRGSGRSCGSKVALLSFAVKLSPHLEVEARAMSSHDIAKAEARTAVEGVFERYLKITEQRRKQGLLDVCALPPRMQEGTRLLTPRLAKQPFDYDCMTRARIVDVGPEGSTLVEFRVGQQYSNFNGGFCAAH